MKFDVSIRVFEKSRSLAFFQPLHTKMPLHTTVLRSHPLSATPCAHSPLGAVGAKSEALRRRRRSLAHLKEKKRAWHAWCAKALAPHVFCPSPFRWRFGRTTPRLRAACAHWPLSTRGVLRRSGCPVRCTVDWVPRLAKIPHNEVFAHDLICGNGIFRW